MAGKILVIDDSELVLEWTRLTLVEAGYQVEISNTPFGTQTKAARFQPDLILLDLDMPALDGNQVCEMLKANKRTEDIPVLLHSAAEHERLEQATEQCGADGYIAKAEDPRELVEQIQNFLNLLAKL